MLVASARLSTQPILPETPWAGHNLAIHLQDSHVNDNSPMKPHDYPRRVLLAVTGLSPQVVTETLYALAVQATNPFVPTEVRIITTRQGAEHARLNLLSRQIGWFHRLRADYHLPEIAFGPESIRVIPTVAGEAMDDIRSPEDNTRAADFITEQVRDLTADADSALHVSIAGGRKTMGYYLGYALSLLGREQDRLSHVLVSAPYENNRDFYYPTPYECAVHVTQGGKDVAYDCRNATIDLADIPFVRLRMGQPRRLSEGHVTFSAAVAAATRATLPPRLVLAPADGGVWADDELIPLKPTEMAVLLWFASRVCNGTPEVSWGDPDVVREFLCDLGRMLGTASGAYERAEKALAACKGDPDAIGRYFEPHLSRIKGAFREALTETAAQRYLIQQEGERNARRYRLPLSLGQIERRGGE